MQNPNELTFPEPQDAPQFQVHHMGGHSDSLAALRGKGGNSWGKIGLATIVLAAAVVGYQRLTAPPEPATVVLAVTTPASVEIGVSVDGAGMNLQKSPIKIEKLSAKGEHRIELSSEGFKSETVTVSVKEGEVKTLPAVALEPVKVDSGFTLSSKPEGAAVTIDGNKAGVTPFRTTTLEAGKHVVRVENGFTHEPWEGPVEITAGKVLELPPVQLVALSKAKVKKAERAAKLQAKLQAKSQSKLHAKLAQRDADALNFEPSGRIRGRPDRDRRPGRRL